MAFFFKCIYRCAHGRCHTDSLLGSALLLKYSQSRGNGETPLFSLFFFLPAFPLSAPISVQCCIISLHSRIKIYLIGVKGFSGRHYPNNPAVIASFLCKHVHTLLHNHNRMEAMVFHGRKLQEYPQFRVRYLNSAGFTTVTGIAVSVFQIFLIASIFNFQCLKIGI